MKKLIMLYGIISLAFALYAEPNLNAGAHFKITDDLPRYAKGGWYNGILSVTNTGEVAFVVVSDKECVGETIRFYREGNEEWQRLEDESVRGKQRREQERKEAASEYYSCVEGNISTKTLLPGESISFECRGYFKLPHGLPGDLYKAEMYLGHDTWVPVHITPTLGTLLPIKHDSREPAGDFYYSQEGTNQYLYVKVDDKFKRVGEMKLKSTPQKEGKENTVTFETPDGETKKLTRDQAREVVREREQQNQ